MSICQVDRYLYSYKVSAMIGKLISALLSGLVLRCPQCHKGSMFSSWFTMRRSCSHCQLEFEKASGEITGGMGVNIVATLFIAIISAAIIGFSEGPLLLPLLIMSAVMVIFPIVFYPSSRGMWVALLYVTGGNDERD
jgi:uncharacterized protein (DUF983 family)